MGTEPLNKGACGFIFRILYNLRPRTSGVFLGVLLEGAEEGEEDPSAMLPVLWETGISQGCFGERGAERITPNH